jgi:hypothetical protein
VQQHRILAKSRTQQPVLLLLANQTRQPVLVPPHRRCRVLQRVSRESRNPRSRLFWAWWGLPLLLLRRSLRTHLLLAWRVMPLALLLLLLLRQSLRTHLLRLLRRILQLQAWHLPQVALHQTVQVQGRLLHPPHLTSRTVVSHTCTSSPVKRRVCLPDRRT